MKYLFFLSISFISCQKELTEVVKAGIPKEEEIEIVEIQFPEFKGGEEELAKYISTKIENSGIKDDICAEAIIKFEVSASGKVENVNVIRAGEKCVLFKEKLITIFRNMPKWKPGLSNNRAIRYKMRYYYQRKWLDGAFESAFN